MKNAGRQQQTKRYTTIDLRRNKVPEYLLIVGQRDRIDPASIRQNLNTIKPAQKLLVIFDPLIHIYVAIACFT